MYLVVGARGQLGSELRLILKDRAVYVDRDELDITDAEMVANFFASHQFEAVVNCAAYTAVDKAESDVELATKINVDGPKFLAQTGVPLVHISTDYVFDGQHFKPYTEDDKTNPQSVYGETKLVGEEQVLQHSDTAVIIRTAWLYSVFGNNFVKTMRRLGAEKDSLNVVFDQTGTPTNARDLANAIVEILPRIKKGSKEVYHFSNEGVCSWYDFAKEVMAMSGFECKVYPIEAKDYPTPAKRPFYSVLNKAKIKRDFGLKINHWKDSLAACIKELEEMLLKAILVTGGAGFIGANFVPYFAAKYPEYKVINLDKLTYAGDLKNLSECEGMANYTFVQGDICDSALLEKLFQENDIRGVVHFAAESHVDNSITGPRAFIETNLVGTFNLLDAARKHWLEAPHKLKSGYEDARFHHISTDEVYGTLGETGLFMETTPYAPNSPYSASKAGSDLLVRSYFHTYGMNVTTSNCSNNYGPKQHTEKLIPKIIANCLNEKQIPIYGDGKNIRDWLYVLDHCKAIDLVFHKGKAGETYNVGGRNERNNLQIVDAICSIMDKKHPKKPGGSYKDLITFVQDRAGHDRRYAIDATKLETELGWRADENFETGIVKTVDWYLNKLV